MHRVNAKYEGGLLHPAMPLPLQAGERVRLIVFREGDPSRWDLQRLVHTSDEEHAMATAGLGEWADALDAEDRG